MKTFKKQLRVTRTRSAIEADKNLGRRLIDHDPGIREVIAEMPIQRYDLIGSQLSFQITDQIVHVIPRFIAMNHSRYAAEAVGERQVVRNQDASGQFNELYQDYVASVSKGRWDLFLILPLEEVYVTCLSECEFADRKSLFQFSVQFTEALTASTSTLDPSDSMRNFHAMSFKKSKGFEAIDPLVPMS
ncbi:MAG: hypothetical protein R3C52_06680 [Hyphomonadaceae bacterium]